MVEWGSSDIPQVTLALGLSLDLSCHNSLASLSFPVTLHSECHHSLCGETRCCVGPLFPLKSLTCTYRAHALSS